MDLQYSAKSCPLYQHCLLLPRQWLCFAVPQHLSCVRMATHGVLCPSDLMHHSESLSQHCRIIIKYSIIKLDLVYYCES